jgi:hypothetical protein
MDQPNASSKPDSSAVQRGSTTAIERARHELDANRPWKAKEILRGNITNHGYDRQLFEEYGRLLQQLGEELEAGKYLFLSGVHKPEYERAIDLFVSRFSRKKPIAVYHEFPSIARLGRCDDYPVAVADRLKQLGLPEKLPKYRSSVEQRIATTETVLSLGCLFAFIGLIVLGIMGLVSAIMWIAGER